MLLWLLEKDKEHASIQISHAPQKRLYPLWVIQFTSKLAVIHQLFLLDVSQPLNILTDCTVHLDDSLLDRLRRISLTVMDSFGTSVCISFSVWEPLHFQLDNSLWSLGVYANQVAQSQRSALPELANIAKRVALNPLLGCPLGNKEKVLEVEFGHVDSNLISLDFVRQFQ